MEETSPWRRGPHDSPLWKKLENDIQQAMRAGDKARLSTLGMLKAAVINAEIARNAPADESDILGVIAREVKQRQESIEAFKQGGRPDLAAREEAELELLNLYLPRQLTHDEIVAEAHLVIQEVGAQGPRDKGKVMPKLVARLKGRADGREINAVVTELLG